MADGYPLSPFLVTSRKGSPGCISIIITFVKLKEKEIFVSRWYKDEQLWFSSPFLAASSQCGIGQEFSLKLHHELLFLFVCLFWANFSFLSALFFPLS